MQKATLRVDGQYYTTIAVRFDLSLMEMALQFTAATYYKWGNEEVVSKARKLSKAEVVNVITEQLRLDGWERASYIVGDNNLEEELEEVLSIFRKRFAKEFPNG